MTAYPAPPLDTLAARLQSLLDADYPRFSAAEMQVRRAALTKTMDAAGVDHLLMCGENRAGSGVQWLTAWPVTAEAVALVARGTPDTLYVQFYNHLPLARRLAAEADVQWGGPSTVGTVIAELKRRGAKRVGVMGTLGFGKYNKLAEHFDTVDMNAAYVGLRLQKSAEEIDWLRIGAAFCDRAIEALRAQMRPGLSERELWDITERAYVPHGGGTHIHYFGVTSMARPDCHVPRQFASARRLAAGDVVFTEISGAFWDYPGQVLRSFAVAAEPTPLYRDLYAVADAAFEAVTAVLRHGTTMQEIVAASAMIETAGFTSCDDLLHGFGGGYLPPVLGSASRPAGPLPALTLEVGMTVVVQPNVITRDGSAGVQVGELVHITADGYERLHAAPREFFRVG